MAGLPSGTTLKTLPLRALVAYAARCAHRVQPYFHLPFEHPEAETAEKSFQEAMQVCLDFVRGVDVMPVYAQAVEDALVRALIAVSEGESPDTKAALSCNAMYAAINAAVLALHAVKAPSRATQGSKVVAAAVTSSEAALVVDPDIKHKVIRDFQILTRLSLGRFPDWGRPFDAGPSGTLGPLTLTRDAELALKKNALQHA